MSVFYGEYSHYYDTKSFMALSLRCGSSSRSNHGSDGQVDKYSVRNKPVIDQATKGQKDYLYLYTGTLSSTCKLQELEVVLSNIKWVILGIIEYQRKHEDQIILPTGNLLQYIGTEYTK